MLAGSYTQSITVERTLGLSAVVLFLSCFIAGSGSLLDRDHRIIVDLLRKNSTADAIETRWDISFDDCCCSAIEIRPDLSKVCVGDNRLTLDRTAILASELIQLYLFPIFHLRKCTRRRILFRTFVAACVFIISSTVLILFTNAYLHHHMAFIVMTSGVVLFLYVLFN